MFNLAQTAEQTALADALRQLGERAIRPMLTHGGKASTADLAKIWLDLHEMGLTAPVSAEYDGQGTPDSGTALLIAEELGFADPGIAYDLVSTAHAALMVEALGTERQRVRYLPRFAKDPQFSAGAGYFEGFGRSPGELGTVAKRTGDHWELTGRKIGVTRPAALDLLIVVAANTETGEPVAFAVEPSTIDGFQIARDDDAVGKLGLDAVKTGIIELQAAVLPDTARLSGRGADSIAVHRSVAALRLGVGGVLLGAAKSALAYATRYASTREAFGQPIAQYQGVAFPLADVDTELDATRLQLWRTADAVASADHIEAIVPATAEAVARSQRTSMEAGRIGINTLGGHGFIQDHPIEQWYRAAATLAALDFDPLESDNVAL